MKPTTWAVVFLIGAAIQASAQQPGSQGQNTRSSMDRGAAKQSTDDLDSFVQQYQTKQTKPTPPAPVPACDRLTKLGLVMDRLYGNPVDEILAAVEGVGQKPDPPAVDGDTDPVWDELMDCANQTHRGSERTEALRVAAMWEGRRAEQFRKAYREVLPIPAGMCKDLDKLNSEVTAGWPKRDVSGNYHFPPNYRFPGDFSRIQTQLLNCTIESKELNKNKPVPEYVRASDDIGSLNVFSGMEKSTATQSEVMPVGRLSAPNEVERSEAHQIPGGDCDQIITVAGLTPNGLALYIPPEGQRFMAKSAKDYARMCLVEDTNAAGFARGVPHYLLVWAYSENAFAGFQPVQQVATSPISGSGTVTNLYGDGWNFTYNGTLTEIDTMEAPYVLQSRSLFLWAYDGKGRIVSRHSISTSSQAGGDASYTAGYNAGALISLLWNNPSRLIKDVLKDVQKASGQ